MNVFALCVFLSVCVSGHVCFCLSVFALMTVTSPVSAHVRFCPCVFLPFCFCLCVSADMSMTPFLRALVESRSRIFRNGANFSRNGVRGPQHDYLLNIIQIKYIFENYLYMINSYLYIRNYY